MKVFWHGLSKAARVSLIMGVIIIAATTMALAFWTLRADYQVLFSDLKSQDTVAMTAELEKLKIPYRVDEAGTAILVEKSQVHATRIKLMGKELPLQGAVGFELFNNTDFGMTEFAQKINYQRALQGELTRTILSLSEIKDVRVHLALPEQGLFKQASAKPKAAITITLREGQSLHSGQVQGIQRLVAAATPGMFAQDVTVVDKKGVALTRAADDSVESVTGQGSTSGHARIELKQETETQLARKATAVLDKAFGPGQALASVDVVLNMDQVRITTEDVIPSPFRSGDGKGVVVKERESLRDGNVPPLDAGKNNGVGGSTQREVDYQVGRRVEQVVSAAGTVRRIQVVAVVRQLLDSNQEEQLRRLLAAAVGAVPERGDAVVVQSLQVLATTVSAAQSEANALSAAAASFPVVKTVDVPATSFLPPFAVGIAILACFVLALALLTHTLNRQRARNIQTTFPPKLSAAERQAVLQRVQEWMKQTSRSSDAFAGPSEARTPGL